MRTAPSGGPRRTSVAASAPASRSRGGRHRRGQRAQCGRRGGPARQHPAQRGVHGGERGVGVPHRNGDDERGARVHRPHGGGAEARAVGVRGMQELEQVVQRELTRGERAERALSSANALPRRPAPTPPPTGGR